MDIWYIIGNLLSIFIGITLGLIGGGGSILTLPILVYVMGIDPVLGTAYSLFVVGATALAGTGRYMQAKLIDYRTAVVFAVPSFIAVFLTRKFLVPAIPDPMFSLGEFEVGKNLGIMVFFAVIMLASSYSMIRSGGKKEEEAPAGPAQYNYPMILLEGAVVGVITGIVGAGGGFLIIPALVLLARLPMKMAVGTSLLIIAAKSLFGFLGDLGTQPIEWPTLLIFTSLSIVGMFIGTWLTKYIPGSKLKAAFGWFVLVMGTYIILKELAFS